MDNCQKCVELGYRNLILIYREPTVFHIHMRKIEILYIERKLYTQVYLKQKQCAECTGNPFISCPLQQIEFPRQN